MNHHEPYTAKRRVQGFQFRVYGVGLKVEGASHRASIRRSGPGPRTVPLAPAHATVRVRGLVFRARDVGSVDRVQNSGVETRY